MKKGFTLIEILVAVMIVTLLVTAAVPIYEKTVEKSRIAEARLMLKKVLESKLRVLDSMELNTYSGSEFGFQNLDIKMACSGTCAGNKVNTKDFTFTMSPSGYPLAVCAARRSGDNKGVNFLFLGELAGSSYSETRKLLCNNGSSGGSCEAYSMTSEPTAYCTPA